MTESLPDSIPNVAALEEHLSRPSSGVVDALSRLSGDLMLLGVGGKMGLSLSVMARRALDLAGKSNRVIGVSRFTRGGQAQFTSRGVETIACDLLDECQVASLPDVENLVVMTGRKFGSTGDEPFTWAMNALIPSIVCRRFPKSRLVVFSTGNVYGLSPVGAGGSCEADTLQPAGEYAQSCLARERIYHYCCVREGIPLAIVRLNYACDLRYGVLVDLARRVRLKQPIDLAMGWFNTIWQQDANTQALQAFDHLTAPPWVVNVTGPELLSVRTVCEQFGSRWGVPVTFTGAESETALISRVDRSLAAFGSPSVSASRLIDWVADWIERDQPWLGKPTHFESRSGQF